MCLFAFLAAKNGADTALKEQRPAMPSLSQLQAIVSEERRNS